MHKHQIQVNELSPKAKSSFKSRVIVALILVALVAPAIVLGSWVLFIMLIPIAILGIGEMMRATGKKYPWYIHVVTYFIVLSFIFWFIIKVNVGEYIEAKRLDPSVSLSNFPFSLENYFSELNISIIGIGFAIGVYFLLGIVDNKHFDFSDVLYFSVFSILLGIGFQAILFLRYYPFYLFGTNQIWSSSSYIWYGKWTGKELINQPIFKYLGSCTLLFFVIAGTCINDIFAYIVGSLFGKHKMAPVLSPNKTWEGFFGGWFFGTASMLAIGLPTSLNGCPILPTLSGGGIWWVVLLSIVIPVISDIGDLSFSMIKRHFQIKDFGSILKGHGGVIDRVGSALFTAMLAAMLLIFITNGWNFFA
ncbi:MAG: phosphatidate cytidylyltransferase [Bacilli bacterium]|nr:phosphatidate cytidylyltransferase [Bacilli bacterium]